MNEDIKFNIIILTLILLVSVALITVMDHTEVKRNEIDYCEEYANARNVSISYPGRVYTFNNITIDEKTLKESCEKIN